jgi:hypothetical protein
MDIVLKSITGVGWPLSDFFYNVAERTKGESQRLVRVQRANSQAVNWDKLAADPLFQDISRWALLRYGLRWGKYGCKRNRQSEERLNMVALSPCTIYCELMSYQVLFVWVPS